MTPDQARKLTIGTRVHDTMSYGVVIGPVDFDCIAIQWDDETGRDIRRCAEDMRGIQRAKQEARDTMIRDPIRIGPFAVTINASDEEAAASVGEYVTDAIDAGVGLEEISAAARVAFRFASRVRRWPGFGEDWR